MADDLTSHPNNQHTPTKYTQWDADSLQCVRKVSSDTPGPLGPLLLLPRPAALLEMLPKGVQPAPLQPLKKYKTAIQPRGGGGAGGNQTAAALAAAAVQVGGDLAVVLGCGGEGVGQGQNDFSSLFWRGGPTAGTPARALPSQAAAAAAEDDAAPASGLKRGREEQEEEGSAGGSASEDEEEEAAPAKAKGRGKKGGGAQAKGATTRGGNKKGQQRQK